MAYLFKAPVSRVAEALEVAAFSGDTTTVTRLLEEDLSGIEPKWDTHGEALQIAVYYGHEQIVKDLVAAGANLHHRGRFHDSLHAAASSGHRHLVLFLLNKGYRVSPSPSFGGCHLCHRPQFRELFHDYPLTQLDNQRVSSVKSLTSIRPSFAKNLDYFALEASADAGHKEVVRLFIENRSSLEISESSVTSAMQAAASNGHLDVLKLLLDSAKRCGPIRGYMALLAQTAAKYRRQEILHYTLNMAAENGFTAEDLDQLRLGLPPCLEKYKVRNAVIRKTVLRADFVKCCELGDQETIPFIIKYRRNPVIRAKDVSRGVAAAAGHGHYSMIAFLLDHPLVPDPLPIADAVFFKAALSNHLEVLKLLTSRRTQIYATPFALAAALHGACVERRAEIVRCLVDGLDVDVKAEIPPMSALGLVHPHDIRRKWTSKIGLFAADDTSSSDESDSTLHNPSSALVGRPKNSTKTVTGASSNNQRKKPNGESAASANTLTSKSKLWLSPLQMALRSCKGHGWIDKPCMSREEQTRAEEIVTFLLRRGADPNGRGSQEEHPLVMASRFAPCFVVEQMIAAGGSFASPEEGHLAFRYAAGREMESAAITRQLLQIGVSFPESMDEGSVLVEEALKFFVGDQRREPDGRFRSAPSLQYVFDEGPGAVLELLLRHYKDLTLDDSRYLLVLQMVCVLGRLDFVHLLLLRGVDVNTPGCHYGTPLQAAAHAGQEDIVRVLLKSGAHVDILQGRWGTPLRAAVAGGHSKIVSLLIDCGASLYLEYKATSRIQHDNTQTSILQLAIKSGNADTVKALLSAGLTIAEETGNVQNPLIVACQLGHVDIVELFLEAGVNVNMSGTPFTGHKYLSVQYASPLHAAIIAGHQQVVELLVASGADGNNLCGGLISSSPFLLAISQKSLKVVQLMLGAGVDLARDGRLAMGTAVRDGLEIVKALMKAGVVPASTEPHFNSLTAACQGGNVDVVEFILETLCNYVFDPTPFIDEALADYVRVGEPKERILTLLFSRVTPTPKYLLEACVSGCTSVAAHMLDQGISVHGIGNMKEDNPLYMAIRHLRAGVVELLIQRGAAVQDCAGLVMTAVAVYAKPYVPTYKMMSPNARFTLFQNGSTHFACLQQCQRIVKILLQHGASVQGSNDLGTPLHMACLAGATKLVELLLDSGSDVNAVSGYFETPLLAAVQGKRAEVVSLLLDRGAAVNHVHPELGTPLHLACDSDIQDQAIVCRLLEHGASPDIANAQGETVFTIALKREIQRSPFKNPNPYQEAIFASIIRHTPPNSQLCNENDLLEAAQVIGSARRGGLLHTLLETNKEVTISEDLIVRILSLRSACIYADSLKLLLERTGGLGVTEKMLMAGPPDGILRTLLDTQAPICKITPSIIAAQKYMSSVDCLVKLDKDIPITEEVIVAALQADRSGYSPNTNKEPALLALLWERNPFLPVTHQMLRAATSANEIDFLLERLESPTAGTLQDVVDAWVANGNNTRGPFRGISAAMLRRVLQADEKVQLTPEMLVPVFRDLGTASPELATTLDAILAHDPALPITEELFCVLAQKGFRAKDSQHQKECLEVLIKRGKKIVFTQKMRDAL